MATGTVHVLVCPRPISTIGHIKKPVAWAPIKILLEIILYCYIHKIQMHFCNQTVDFRPLNNFETISGLLMYIFSFRNYFYTLSLVSKQRSYLTTSLRCEIFNGGCLF